MHVIGTATYEGQSVEEGSITLRPAAGAAVVNSKCEIPENHALAGGK